jgi:hypothetical protein
MEHRIGQRSSCALSVILRTRDGRLINGEIRDISAGGAFIRIADDIAAPRGLVELTFEALFPERKLCKWSSLVVRRSADGIGVMFDERHNEAAACRMRPQTSGYEHSAGVRV